jgi:hypothetical protein
MRRIRPEVYQPCAMAAALGFDKRLLLRRRCGGGLLEAVGAPEFLAEAFDAAGGVDEFLFTGEERMALVADIDADAGLGAAGHESVAAGAVDAAGHITGMGFLFHGLLLCPDVRGRGFAATSAGAPTSKSGWEL